MPIIDFKNTALPDFEASNDLFKASQEQSMDAYDRFMKGYEDFKKNRTDSNTAEAQRAFDRLKLGQLQDPKVVNGIIAQQMQNSGGLFDETAASAYANNRIGILQQRALDNNALTVSDISTRDATDTNTIDRNATTLANFKAMMKAAADANKPDLVNSIEQTKHDYINDPKNRLTDPYIHASTYGEVGKRISEQGKVAQELHKMQLAAKQTKQNNLVETGTSMYRAFGRDGFENWAKADNVDDTVKARVINNVRDYNFKHQTEQGKQDAQLIANKNNADAANERRAKELQQQQEQLNNQLGANLTGVIKISADGNKSIDYSRLGNSITAQIVEAETAMNVTEDAYLKERLAIVSGDPSKNIFLEGNLGRLDDVFKKRAVAGKPLRPDEKLAAVRALASGSFRYDWRNKDSTDLDNFLRLYNFQRNAEMFAKRQAITTQIMRTVSNYANVNPKLLAEHMQIQGDNPNNYASTWQLKTAPPLSKQTKKSPSKKPPSNSGILPVAGAGVVKSLADLFGYHPPEVNSANVEHSNTKTPAVITTPPYSRQGMSVGDYLRLVPGVGTKPEDFRFYDYK